MTFTQEQESLEAKQNMSITEPEISLKMNTLDLIRRERVTSILWYPVGR